MSLEIHSKLRRCGPLLLAGVLMVNSLPIGALAANIRDFKDVDGHWAYNALDWAVENGVMTGTSEDTMSPDGFLTRAQMATMIDRLYGAYKGADISAFTDVAMGSWYYDYIAQAVQMGTLAGYDGNIMRPNDHITREQAIVVIARALCLMMEYDEDLSKFSDARPRRFLGLRRYLPYGREGVCRRLSERRARSQGQHHPCSDGADPCQDLRSYP